MFQEIELCNSNIKKIYYIFSEENHTYISGNGTLHFFSHSSKNNKIHPEKIYTSGDKTPKKISYIFSKKLFRETDTRNGNPRKVSYISGVTCKAWKSKISYTFSCKEPKFLYFFIIIIKHFFPFYNIFFCTQQAFVFHLLRHFCSVHNHIVGFCSFLFRRILVPFSVFFCSLSSFSW